jgi:DNA-binding response OmpR family regulator
MCSPFESNDKHRTLRGWAWPTSCPRFLQFCSRGRVVTRILVIDDDEAIRSLIKTLLGRKGFEVQEAPDGVVGTRIFREKPADLVITDVFMPEKGGLDTIVDLRKDFPDVKIIVMSGGGSTMSADGCLLLAKGLGVQRTLFKPLRMRELLEAVESALGRGKHSDVFRPGGWGGNPRLLPIHDAKRKENGGESGLCRGKLLRGFCEGGKDSACNHRRI